MGERRALDPPGDTEPMRLLTAILLAAVAATPPLQGGTMSAESFYVLQTTTLQGRPTDLADYAGKVTLVVNVASKCGFTPQYAGLQKLHDELKGRGFSVLGFPSNDFANQEPGTAEEIAQFCQKNYGVTFPMFAKVVTKAGEGQSPIYAFLGQTGKLPAWNFGRVPGGPGRQGGRLLPEQGGPGVGSSRRDREGALGR
jgi:glutathione peroxidase